MNLINLGKQLWRCIFKIIHASCHNIVLKTICYVFITGFSLLMFGKIDKRTYIHFCVQIITYPGIMSILI